MNLYRYDSTMLVCDRCSEGGKAKFLRQTKNYTKYILPAGWRYLRKTHEIICPHCADEFIQQYVNSHHEINFHKVFLPNILSFEYTSMEEEMNERLIASGVEIYELLNELSQTENPEFLGFKDKARKLLASIYSNEADHEEIH